MKRKIRGSPTRRISVMNLLQVKQIVALLKEYLCSCDIAEATRDENLFSKSVLMNKIETNCLSQ